MKFIPVKIDSRQKEIIPYGDLSFPVDIWTDVYDNFVDETLNCHWHPQFEFGALTAGALDFNIGDVSLRLGAGDCIFVNANMMHFARQARGHKGSVIKGVGFTAAILESNTGSSIYKKYFEPMLTGLVQGFVMPRDADFTKKIYALILEINAQSRADIGYELSCLSLLNRLWRETILYTSGGDSKLINRKASQKHEERTKKIMEYIHENFAETIKIEDLASHAHISPSECFRCFKHFTGKTIVEYVNEYRLACAAKMLAESDIPVTDAAMACGFNSSSYFGKLFLQTYGVTPGRYRSHFLS